MALGRSGARDAVAAVLDSCSGSGHICHTTQLSGAFSSHTGTKAATTTCYYYLGQNGARWQRQPIGTRCGGDGSVGSIQ